MAAMELETGKVDEALYSRQLYVLGREGQSKMASSTVLVCGLTGTGAEVAKNVILAGVKAVTLYDPTTITHRCLGGNPYARIADVGKPRADCCAPRLAELNPYVNVSVMKNGSSGEAMGSLHSTDVDEWRARVRGYRCVAICDAVSEDELKAIDDACRRENVCLVACESRGVCTSLFCDFGATRRGNLLPWSRRRRRRGRERIRSRGDGAFVGPRRRLHDHERVDAYTGDEWTVTDADGEPGAACLVASITQTNPALITVVDEQRHGLEVGDIVSLTSCVGCDSLNDRELKVLRVCSPYSYEVDADATTTTPYVSSGYAQHKKDDKIIQHKPYGSQFEDDSFLRCDFAKYERPPTLHNAFLALRKWRSQNSGAFPAEKDVESVVALFEKTSEDKCEDVCRDLALTSAGDLSPMAAFLGGVAGQEVLKACTGKFAPVRIQCPIFVDTRRRRQRRSPSTSTTTASRPYLSQQTAR